MKKQLLVFIIAILSLSIIITACGNQKPQTSSDNTEESTIVMKLANANPPGDIKDKTALKFAELVNEKTNGKVKIEVYSGGTLGDWKSTIEGLGLGIVQVVIEGLGSLDSWAPIASLSTAPYMLRDAEHFNKVFNDPVGKEFIAEVENQGHFKLIGPMYRGARVVTSTKPFKNVDELKGLKIRVPNTQLMIKIWQALGASPTPLALTETFTALQQGTVDAQENPIIESYGHGFYDVTKYLIRTNHCLGADIFIFNDEYFNSLPQEIQNAIEEAANEAATWRNEMAVNTEEEYIKKFEEKGVTIIEPDLESFQQKLSGFLDDYAPDLVPMAEKIKSIK
ncbi:TRAP transporter substrate-binding protein [Tepidanaerobacter acetatoxydans]|uniref:TRAP transporter substrate-binding protein n=1 Tax=Tepidanaerobacter acetatoxydans TaxID=499229 RepID=UPI001BD30B56|nr:TRAP transporter substrate-binding protein [Tepidanaerobacter acetatoxydans]